MRISDWSSDVCSSDLRLSRLRRGRLPEDLFLRAEPVPGLREDLQLLACGLADDRQRPGDPAPHPHPQHREQLTLTPAASAPAHPSAARRCRPRRGRSEEHTSELQSLMRISYAVFCLKKKPNEPHL